MIDNLVRENIRKLKPYSSARDEFKSAASIYLDANENAYKILSNETVNRYPDPHQQKLKEALALLKGVSPKKIFLGNGSDEIIDLTFRIFCEPAKHNAIICVPTYGMYEVSAQINNVEVKKVLLKADFQLDVEEVLRNADDNSRLLFLCSPNNPTGNIFKKEDIELLIANFKGIVIVDEAYIDFSSFPSRIESLNNYENLLVMQTLSKAWGLAGLRIGVAFGSERLVQWFQKVKPPYNINSKSQELAISALENKRVFDEYLPRILKARSLIFQKLQDFPFVLDIFESEANFLLVRVKDAYALYNYLASKGIVVRNRSKDEMCNNCLRITIGTEKENLDLIKALEAF